MIHHRFLPYQWRYPPRGISRGLFEYFAPQENITEGYVVKLVGVTRWVGSSPEACFSWVRTLFSPVYCDPYWPFQVSPQSPNLVSIRRIFPGDYWMPRSYGSRILSTFSALVVPSPYPSVFMSHLLSYNSLPALLVTNRHIRFSWLSMSRITLFNIGLSMTNADWTRYSFTISRGWFTLLLPA